jgi:hypothetical protein
MATGPLACRRLVEPGPFNDAINNEFGVASTQHVDEGRVLGRYGQVRPIKAFQFRHLR